MCRGLLLSWWCQLLLSDPHPTWSFHHPRSSCPNTLSGGNIPTGKLSHSSCMYTLSCIDLTGMYLTSSPPPTQASRQSSCTPCLPGLYCPDRGLILGETCPQGSYCPSGSAVPTSCPRGTFSNTEGLFNASSCDFCIPGSYCIAENLTAPSGFCYPGYYCLAGAELPNPVNPIVKMYRSIALYKLYVQICTHVHAHVLL